MSLCGNASLLFKFLLLHKNFPQKLIVYQTFRENGRNVAPNKQGSSKTENVKPVLLQLEAGGEPERSAGFSIYTTAFDMMFSFGHDVNFDPDSENRSYLEDGTKNCRHHQTFASFDANF